MGPTEHCKLSPSKSESWINCNPSLKAGEEIEDESSSYASEGTAAHALGEWKGKRLLKMKAGRLPIFRMRQWKRPLMITHHSCRSL